MCDFQQRVNEKVSRELSSLPHCIVVVAMPML
jgi:hypothetical protein